MKMEPASVEGLAPHWPSLDSAAMSYREGLPKMSTDGG